MLECETESFESFHVFREEGRLLSKLVDGRGDLCVSDVAH